MQIPENEYAPFYKGYVDKAMKFSIVEGLLATLQDYQSFFTSFPSAQWEYLYAEGKWTPKELVLHLIDAERVFSYRALMLVRSSGADLKGFDQDEFVENSEANARSVASLQEEFTAVRQATIALYSSLSDKDLSRTGQVSGALMSVRALGKIMIGHCMHHLQIMEERYR